MAADWKRDWETEMKGRHLRQPQVAPSRNILETHKGLQKGLSSLVAQMRKGKVGLRKFLFDRRVPEVKTRDESYLVEQNRRLTAYYQCVGCSNAWSNITTKPILALPKYAREAATFMKNTGLLIQFIGHRKGLRSRIGNIYGA